MQDQQQAPAPVTDPAPWRYVDRGAMGDQWVYRFANGYGASVVRGPYSYGGEAGLFELGVVTFDGDKHTLTYETPITEDVIGHQDASEIAGLLTRIAALPAASAQ